MMTTILYPSSARRITRTFVAGAAVAAAAFGLSACSSPSSDAAAAGADELTTVTLALDYLPGAAHNGLAYAMHEGLFEEQGIELEIVPFSGASADTLVVAGQADVSITPNLGSALLQFATGAPVKVIFNIMPSNPAVITVLAESGIESPKDLAGTIYGGWGVPSETAEINRMIQFDGGEGETESVTLGGGMIEALLAGRIDSTASYPEDRARLKTDGVDTLDFRFEDYGSPQNGGSMILANDAWLTENPDVVRGFLAALQEGYEAADSDPEAVTAALVAEFPDVDAEQAIAAAPFYAELRANDFGPVGTLSLEQFQTFADYQIGQGLLVDAAGAPLTELDPAPFVTNEYLPE